MDKDVRNNGRQMFVTTTGLDERLLNDKRLKSITRISTKTPCSLRNPQIPSTKSPSTNLQFPLTSKHQEGLLHSLPSEAILHRWKPDASRAFEPRDLHETLSRTKQPEYFTSTLCTFPTNALLKSLYRLSTATALYIVAPTSPP